MELSGADEQYMLRMDRATLLSALIESSQDAILAKTLSGRITFWNAGAERLFGYTAAEAVGMNILMLSPDDRREEESRLLEDLRAGRLVEHYETERIRKDGTRVAVSLRLSPIKTADGTIVGCASIADITAKKQAEDRFRLVFEAAPNGLMIVAADGRIKLANTAAADLFGYAKDELLEQPVEMLVPPALRAQHVAHRETFQADPKRRPMGRLRDLVGLRKDGTPVPIELGLSPITSEGGHFVLAAIVDLTERRQATEALARQTRELERSNADLEEFAYVASHDLQEPLRMVVSFTELLARRNLGRLDEKSNEFIGFIVEGAKRMQGLISDLLTCARVGTEGTPFESVDMALLVDQVIAGLRESITTAQAEIAIDVLPTVRGDLVQLRQLLQNLISNAIKFRAERPPRIHIGAKRKGAEWLFCVEDNGIGIDMRFSDRIFQMFQRLHERGTYEGNGIGLALAKKIAERHGGRIWAESEPGIGTRFYFTLPTGRNGMPR